MRHYFENHGNVEEWVRKLRKKLERREAPSALYLKLKKTGIPIDKPKREKPKTVHIPDNITAVAEIHRRSQQLTFRRHH